MIITDVNMMITDVMELNTKIVIAVLNTQVLIMVEQNANVYAAIRIVNKI